MSFYVAIIHIHSSHIERDPSNIFCAEGKLCVWTKKKINSKEINFHCVYSLKACSMWFFFFFAYIRVRVYTITLYEVDGYTLTVDKTFFHIISTEALGIVNVLSYTIMLSDTMCKINNTRHDEENKNKQNIKIKLF